MNSLVIIGESFACADGHPHARGLTISDAAGRLGLTRAALSRVLNGHAGVSPNLALRLEQAGVGTARLWVAMQGAYDLAQERQKATALPVRELARA